MQLSLPIFAAMIGLISSTQAVWVCDGFNKAEQACEGVCTEFKIAVNQVVNVPNTQCIFNADSDHGFDLLVCSGANLQGGCSDLKNLPRSDITGDFNWWTPGTGSILRTGN